MENLRISQHFHYIITILEVLKELGGSGKASEVVDLVVEKLNIPSEMFQNELTIMQIPM
jgi:hypothetical protein